ncbi:uncharacterized protein EV154DRAFT_510529 [Mucor mucedo]|uniref:uncharacterized protein n=1 Tax=Mucor mucedo TaxID=29922 RepID=UPI00221F40DD|nr:uncharacterized protein EV154DRAFT_510529 [Mucor mucedo]KAI7890775.1 hypothetical protein EV154DRAFT_510529 [Mucor mucedo]
MPSRVNPLLFIVFAACLNSPICFDLDLSRSPLAIRPIVLLILNKYVVKRISTLNFFMILNNNSSSSASDGFIIRTCCRFAAVMSFLISRSSSQTYIKV